MQVKNVAPGPRGINTTSGQMLLERGQTLDGIEMTEAEYKVAQATGWFELDGVPVVPTLDTDQDEPTIPAIGAYTTKHKGGGNWAILDASGAELADKISKEDAAAFDSSSADEKTAYVKSL